MAVIVRKQIAPLKIVPLIIIVIVAVSVCTQKNYRSISRGGNLILFLFQYVSCVIIGINVGDVKKFVILS